MSDLNKFDVKNPVIESLMMDIAEKIQSVLPPSMRFSLFLFEQAAMIEPEKILDGENTIEVDINVFYASSCKTSEALPLINRWTERQTN